MNLINVSVKKLKFIIGNILKRPEYRDIIMGDIIGLTGKNLISNIEFYGDNKEVINRILIEGENIVKDVNEDVRNFIVGQLYMMNAWIKYSKMRKEIHSGFSSKKLKKERLFFKK